MLNVLALCGCGVFVVRFGGEARTGVCCGVVPSMGRVILHRVASKMVDSEFEFHKRSPVSVEGPGIFVSHRFHFLSFLNGLLRSTGIFLRRLPRSPCLWQRYHSGKLLG